MLRRDTSNPGAPAQGFTDSLRLASSVEALVRAPRRSSVGTRAGSADTSAELTFHQSARALRFALAEFARSGAPAGPGVGAGPEGGYGAGHGAGPAAGLAGRIEEARALASATRELIAQRRFRLVYQPVVSLADRRPHHFEALLRPLTPEGAQPRTTQEFVSFSEAVGLAEELDLAVLDEVAGLLRGRLGPLVAVNVSGISMQSPAFRDRMLAMASTCPSQLLIELTETAQIEDVDAAAATLRRLRAAGIPVCIDDFGAGAAAFQYLRSFGVDYVKIDGSYVRGASHNDRGRSFAASMFDMARSVGAQIIAEMIETEDDARLMREMGVHLGQGWLFGQAGDLVLPRRVGNPGDGGP
jgi:EAL domain-containing protein (putative c-di-GMP-specific phosphodiesterase class I)